MDVDLLAFAVNYRGPHAPEDAMHWLEHPDRPGPSGAPPPQQDFIILADHYTEAGKYATARAVLIAGSELLAHYRRVTLAAIDACQDD